MRIKKDKILTTIFILVVLLDMLLAYIGYCALLAHREQPRPADKRVEFVIESVEQPYDWREQMRDLFDTPHSVVWEEFENKSRTGYTRLLTRKIHIDVSLNEIDETMTYAHELTHLKYFTANETFVTYQSIIMLYESNNAYFRYVALKNANNIINYHSYKGTRYDCGWLLQQYFEKGE